MSNQLAEQIMQELQQGDIADAPLNLADEYETLRANVAAVQRKVGYLTSDLEKVGELQSRSHAEVSKRITALESARVELGNAADELKQTTGHLLTAIKQSSELQKTHNDRISLLEMKVNRLSQVATEQHATIQKLKTKRLNLFGLIALALTVGVWGNLLLNMSQDISAHSRLNQIENYLGQ